MAIKKDTEETAPSEGPRFQKLFTLDEANRALVLVRRVVAEIRQHYGVLLATYQKMQEFGRDLENSDEFAACREKLEALTDQLNRLNAELLEIGCYLKDWKLGLIDFPAEHHGRVVWLCWKDGEDSIGHWHELDVGFQGRRPVSELTII